MGFADYGLDFHNPDFVQYAASYGASGHRAETAEGLALLISKCLESKGVHVIDVPVDYSRNQELLNQCVSGI